MEQEEGMAARKHASKRKTICILYSSADKQQGSVLAASLEELIAEEDLRWAVRKCSVSKITSSKLLKLATEHQAIACVTAGESESSGIDPGGAARLESLLLRGECLLVFLRLTYRPLPYGFPRGCHRINCSGSVRIHECRSLLNLLELSRSGSKIMAADVQRGLQRRLRSDPLSNVSSGIDPYITRLLGESSDSRRSLYLHTAIYLLDWIHHSALLNDKSIRVPTLSHAGKVLEFLARMCNLSGSAHSKENASTESTFPLERNLDVFLALFGALLHNQPLQRKIPGAKPGKYVDNAAKFQKRTKAFAEIVCSGVPKQPRRLIEATFYLGAEMYKDSLYWNEEVQGSKHTKRDRETRLKTIGTGNLESIAVALRTCDVMDVGHRSIPDLVREAFSSAGYDTGIDCFFRNTFLDNKDFFFSELPDFESLQLRLRWPSTKGTRRLKVMEIVQRTIESQIEETLESLKREVGHHPNLAVNLVSDSVGSVERKYHNDIVWSFFPLAIEYPPSDSIAAMIAIDTLVILIDYVLAAGVRADEGPEFVRKNVDELLSVMARLRRNSHFLPRIVAVARDAIRDIPPEQYKNAVRRALEPERPLRREHKWLERRVRGAKIKTEARCFLVYGESMPVTEWLIGLAGQLKREHIRVIFVHCVRKLLMKKPASRASQHDANYVIDKIAEHDTACALLRAAMRRHNVSEDQIRIDKDVWDMERVPTTGWGDAQAEVLMGARRFLVEGRSCSVVCNYGAGLLSLCAEGIKVPVRVVTREDRLRDSLSAYVSGIDSTSGADKTPNTFSISYSHGDQHNAEDERVPLSQVVHVSTELRDYPRSKAVNRLLSNGQKRGGTSKRSRPAKSKIVRLADATVRVPQPPLKRKKIVKPIILLVATDVEFDAAVSLAGIWESLPDRTYSFGEYKYYDLGFKYPVLLHRCRKGANTPGSAAMRTVHAIAKLKPYAVIAAGIAFGLQERKQHLGDLILAEQIQLYEIQKKRSRGPVSRGDKPSTSTVLSNWLGDNITAWSRTTTRRRRPAVHSGLLLSGEKLVDDPSFVEYLLKLEAEALGGDMEAAGVYVATHGTSTEWIAVKGICDFGKGKTDDCQFDAATNAFDFIYHTLEQPFVADALRPRRKK